MINDYIKNLQNSSKLDKIFLAELLQSADEPANLDVLRKTARDIAIKTFANKIFIRGLIEITNFCKNDCYYCGIRKNNLKADRYRLSPETILKCCEEGYTLGFRTFVLQGGEDFAFDDSTLTEIIKTIKATYPRSEEHTS